MSFAKIKIINGTERYDVVFSKNPSDPNTCFAESKVGGKRKISCNELREFLTKYPVETSPKAHYSLDYSDGGYDYEFFIGKYWLNLFVGKTPKSFAGAKYIWEGFDMFPKASNHVEWRKKVKSEITEDTEMHGKNINEKVDIDGRTRAYRETVTRLEHARKMREDRSRSVQENKFGGLYDDGSGKGAIVPAPVDINFYEAMRVVEKYKAMREKKKTLMGSPKESMEAAVAMKGEKYTMSEEELSDKQKAYRAFFDKALKKFGASSPAKMDDSKKKKFFDYIKANWKG